MPASASPPSSPSTCTADNNPPHCVRTRSWSRPCAPRPSSCSACSTRPATRPTSWPPPSVKRSASTRTTRSSPASPAWPMSAAPSFLPRSATTATGSAATGRCRPSRALPPSPAPPANRGRASARSCPGRSSAGLAALAGAAPGQGLRSGALIRARRTGTKQDQLRSKCSRFEGNPATHRRQPVRGAGSWFAGSCCLIRPGISAAYAG
jgi:hypothetical protein